MDTISCALKGHAPALVSVFVLRGNCRSLNSHFPPCLQALEALGSGSSLPLSLSSEEDILRSQGGQPLTHLCSLDAVNSPGPQNVSGIDSNLELGNSTVKGVTVKQL